MRGAGYVSSVPRSITSSCRHVPESSPSSSSSSPKESLAFSFFFFFFLTSSTLQASRLIVSAAPSASVGSAVWCTHSGGPSNALFASCSSSSAFRRSWKSLRLTRPMVDFLSRSSTDSTCETNRSCPAALFSVSCNPAIQKHVSGHLLDTKEQKGRTLAMAAFSCSNWSNMALRLSSSMACRRFSLRAQHQQQKMVSMHAITREPARYTYSWEDIFGL